MATCFMTKTTCSSSVSFQNVYEYSKVSCSYAGGPSKINEHLSIYNKLHGKKAMVSKKFNTTKDNFFHATIDTTGKYPTILIDDRSLQTQTNLNISTKFKPFALFGYKCKHGFR